MANQINPISLSHQELDLFLQAGWYRTGQSLFTLDFIFLSEWYRVFWLRFGMEQFDFGKKQQQLLRRNSQFTTTICPLHLTEEHHKLYDDYFQSIDFEASPTLFQYLYHSNSEETIFDSRMVEVRDGQRLIAVGIFDIGETSIAGIINYFHPDYRKYSLGKYLILKKIEYAITNNLEWYYPGYIGYKLPKFEYKLEAGHKTAEIYDPIACEWLPYGSEMLENLAISQGLYHEHVIDELLDAYLDEDESPLLFEDLDTS